MKGPECWDNQLSFPVLEHSPGAVTPKSTAQGTVPKCEYRQEEQAEALSWNTEGCDKYMKSPRKEERSREEKADV